MSVPHIILTSWPFVCQKLVNLVNIWRSSDKNKLGHFLAHPVYYNGIGSKYTTADKSMSTARQRLKMKIANSKFVHYSNYNAEIMLSCYGIQCLQPQ